MGIPLDQLINKLKSDRHHLALPPGAQGSERVAVKLRPAQHPHRTVATVSG